MVEITQIALIGIVAYGHIKLFFDASEIPLSPVEYKDRVPYGFASFWIGDRFVKYIDLRQ